MDDKEPKYGLVVTGEVDEPKMWKNSGAEAGDVLVLTKPLGTGVIATAIKKGAAAQNSIQDPIMTRLLHTVTRMGGSLQDTSGQQYRINPKNRPCITRHFRLRR